VVKKCGIFGGEEGGRVMGVACVKFPKRDLTSFLGSSLTHVHVLPEGSQKQFN